MIFKLLLSLFRKRPAAENLEEPEEDCLDPDNPFSEPVVIAFSDVIDLHSIPPRQVRQVVEDYIEQAHERGVEWVRIIHGKGVGVQREIVRSALARSPFVVDFRDAPPEAGGWGATLVTMSVRCDLPATDN
ncbi:MAG TPA: Smr/MutS family protein [Blastocatellia bacterium]|nr:Smr/MutS family protein [Blastocatellia bacterium]